MHAFFSFIPRPLRLAIFGAAVSVILYLTLAPTNDVPGAKLVWDKAAHAIAFGLLVVLGLLMSTHRRKTVIACVWGLAAGIEVAQALMPQFGFSSSQFGCLEKLWTRESNWNPRADNPSSSAYGYTKRKTLLFVRSVSSPRGRMRPISWRRSAASSTSSTITSVSQTLSIPSVPVASAVVPTRYRTSSSILNDSSA